MMLAMVIAVMDIEVDNVADEVAKMHFSARSQWNEMCFDNQRIIFQGEKRKVSLKLMVRLGGMTPPPPYGQPLKI